MINQAISITFACDAQLRQCCPKATIVWHSARVRQAVQQLIDKGRTLAEVKEQIEVPSFKEWTGVDVKTRAENIEFVFSELTGSGKPK